MSKRWFLWQHLIWALLLLRPLYKQWLPFELYAALLPLTLAVKYVVEGFTIVTFTMVTLFVFGLLAELTRIQALQYLTAILVGLLAFFPFRVYQLPESPTPVGFREDSLQNGLHYFEFYPLQTDKPFKLRSIKWNYSKQISKMLQYKNISNNLIKKLCHLMLSYANKYKLKIADGTQLLTQKGIAVSHGKGGTPFYYSSLMMHFAANGYKVGAVQHTQKNRLNLSSRDEIKSYRENEVVKRSEEYLSAIKRLNTDKMVLVGHSYGCATLIQAYHTMDEQMRRRIQRIVLLDPWFFPLHQSTFNKQINCKILILANEDFLWNQPVLQYNRQFIKIHKVEYIVWKDAHHLHQTDMGFVNGNLLGVIKNSALSREMLELNIKAIELFIKGQQVEQAFGEKNLGRLFNPAKFYPIKMQAW